MAVSGTGTQQDPYIVENWNDFLSVKSETTEHYIKFADVANKIIDFNDIQPEGFTSPISMNGHIDFNNWEFKNMKFTGTSSCFIYTSISSTNYPIQEMKNLKLTNFIWEITAEANIYTFYMFLQYSTSPNSSTRCSIKDVRISGYINSTTNISIYIFHNIYDVTSNFVLNLDFYNNTGSSQSINLIMHRDSWIENCNLKLTSKVGSHTFYLGSLKNSLIQGDIRESSVSFGGSSANNVILLNTNSDIYYSGGISVFNKDFAPHITESSSLIGCTTDQLKDPAHLNSVGLNIYGQVV